MEFPEKSLEVVYVPEPMLEFGHAQVCDNPKDGLPLYGPFQGSNDVDNIRVGVVATPKGHLYFETWRSKLSVGIPLPPRKKTDKEHRLHLNEFPGIAEAFGIRIDRSSVVKKELTEKEIDDATRSLNHHEAVSVTSDLYINLVKQHEQNEEQVIDLWVFVLPEIVHERCRPKSKRTGLALQKGNFSKRQKQKSELPLLEPIIDQSDEDIFGDVPDFHRQIKSRMLGIGRTTQLLRETTLAPEQFLNSAGYKIRETQDDSTIAWNLATGIFYKTQTNPPWRLSGMRPGVCYIGLVYKLIPNHPQNHACCAAQMFLSEGDGVVFRGANGPWQTDRNQYHLGDHAAKKLIDQVMQTYKAKHQEYPKEFFIHGRTTFNSEEWNAFADAAPESTNLVGIRIRETRGDTKLFRNGDYPVLRGTAIVLDEQNALLWTSGYVPRLDTYIGPETPNPLEITILRWTGDMPDIRTVIADIMGLTKINYNSCNYNDGLPVTVKFADRVGNILVMKSAQNNVKQPFKFYI